MAAPIRPSALIRAYSGPSGEEESIVSRARALAEGFRENTVSIEEATSKG